MITFLDKLKTEEEKEEVFDKASMVTGSSSERTYFTAKSSNECKMESGFTGHDGLKPSAFYFAPVA